MSTITRSKPNILITGTPGVGKSTLSKQLLLHVDGFEWLEIGEIVKQQKLFDSFDPEYESYVINEDKVLDELEPRMSEGGKILDFHGCDFFPERWIDHVFVLRSDTEVLYDRLVARGYNSKKLDDNIQSEIFQVILDEATDSYNESIITELQNNDNDDLIGCIVKIVTFLDKWSPNK